MRIGAIIGGFALALAMMTAMPTRVAAATLPADPVVARLVSEAGSVAPGATLWVDLHLDIAKGWHVYWRNPGDSGRPTEIAWQLPSGFNAGEVAWPAPERFVVGTIGNYGYSGSADLLVPITAPPRLELGSTAHLAAKAIWLVCSDICIPGEASLALDLPVSAAAKTADPSAAALFAAVRERLPKPAAFAPRFSLSGQVLRLTIPPDALAGLDRPTASFFPFDGNVVDAAAAPQQEPHAGGIELSVLRLGGTAKSPPATLTGVLVLHGTDGSERAYTIAAAGVASPPAGEDAIRWWQALLLALLGGVALNLMPCVFPVLSLKLLGLAVSVHRAEERRHGLAYAAGVIVSFALLGGGLLLLRTGGAAVGWGFQLQSPIVVGLLSYLLFAMGLSLSGVADLGVGLGGIGSRLADRAGLVGAFATGVLAAVVATPCTAPFMGAALGFALIAPTPVALAVFVALGAGLAAPIVLATAVPSVARLLPRPGPWMLWFKQILAFPLYATVAWLLWVLIQEVGPASAFLALLGLVPVGFAVWIYGRTRSGGTAGRRLGTGLATMGLAASVIVAATLAPAGAPPGGATDVASAGLGYENFSPDRLTRLVGEHRPVFVNLTAAWCITCLVNERTTLESRAVRGAFAERHVVALKGDWTRQDPAIAALLLQFGRSGVPLYLFYDTDGTPTVLPQILTEASVLAAVGKI
jgi:thiol:disulfide interchange protein